MMKYIMLVVLFFLTVNVNSQDAVIDKGNMYYRQSQFALAEKQYRKALEADPANATAQFNLANALQKQKKYNEAIGITGKLAKSAEKKDVQSASYYNQGVAYTKQKNLEASIASYKNALKLNPNDNEARENLQKALMELKKKQQEQKQKKPEPKMSQKQAEQKLKLLQQKEKSIQQKLNEKNKDKGRSQAQDW